MGERLASDHVLWSGGDEVGLGLVDDPSGEHEIAGNNVVRIDFTNAVNAGVTNFDFQFNSTTAGETWAVFGSNSATTGYVSVLTGNDELVHTIAGKPFDFYYFKATGASANNVLLAEVSGDVGGAAKILFARLAPFFQRVVAHATLSQKFAPYAYAALFHEAGALLLIIRRCCRGSAGTR